MNPIFQPHRFARILQQTCEVEIYSTLQRAGITIFIRFHPQGLTEVCRRVCGNPCHNSQDISVWNKVGNQHHHPQRHENCLKTELLSLVTQRASEMLSLCRLCSAYSNASLGGLGKSGHTPAGTSVFSICTLVHDSKT